MTNRFFPPIRILHPQPLHRFDARTRGRSPSALAAPAGIWAGGIAAMAVPTATIADPHLPTITKTEFRLAP